MNITATFTHNVEPNGEQYSFPSTVNPEQRHFMDRGQDHLWKISIVQLEEPLTIEELQNLRVELADLYAFMVTLKQREIRRTTEPGSPDQYGIGGGL